MKIKIGSMVKIKLPHATQGTMTAAGTVTKIIGDKIEIKTQLHGYYVVPAPCKTCGKDVYAFPYQGGCDC